eukprot:SAG11_NODE_4532_length_1862_cov_1.564379_2_plen_67_part_00
MKEREKLVLLIDGVEHSATLCGKMDTPNEAAEVLNLCFPGCTGADRLRQRKALAVCASLQRRDVNA